MSAPKPVLDICLPIFLGAIVQDVLSSPVMTTPSWLAPLCTDTTFSELRAALRTLDDPAATRPEGHRGIADCLQQLRRDVIGVKQAFARRLEQLQRAPPRIVAVADPGSQHDDRFQVIRHSTPF